MDLWLTQASILRLYHKIHTFITNDSTKQRRVGYEIW